MKSVKSIYFAEEGLFYRKWHVIEKLVVPQTEMYECINIYHFREKETRKKETKHKTSRYTNLIYMYYQ